MRNLAEFEWECECGYNNIGWWKDAEFAECDGCGDTYSWEELKSFVEDVRPDDDMDIDF
jgi:hypothetical protein